MRYRLEEWQDRHAIRTIEMYDAASETARSLESASRVRSVAFRWIAILASPLLGHLPGEVQYRMETELAVSARGMTIVSAAPLLVIGVLGTLAGFLAMVGGGELFAWLPSRAVSLYLAAESGVRIGSAWIQDEPMGSLPGVLLYRVYEVFRKPGASRAEQRRRPPSEPPPDEDPALDRFRMLEPLLGLLPEADQTTIEIRFGFDPLRWGRASAGVLLAVGGLNAFASLAAFAAGLGGVPDALWLVAGIALCAEQLVRRKAFERGVPRGSVLGAVVRPFARRLLIPRPETGA